MSTRPSTTTRVVAVASLGDVPPGWVLRVQVGARAIAVANLDGALYAFDDACSHAGGPLGDNRIKDGCFVECPWHNAVFDVRTGQPVTGPARKPLSLYPVEVLDGVIHVSLPV